jgi:hypothetical protein
MAEIAAIKKAIYVYTQGALFLAQAKCSAKILP